MAFPESIAFLKEQLTRALDWTDAHGSYDDAVADFPAEHRGVRPEGLPHSAWELIEHIRIVQRDVLDFCHAHEYRELTFPDDYWPPQPAPTDDNAWYASISSYREDRDALKRLVMDPEVELSAVVYHGVDQTYLRELLLVIDHTSNHVGQLVLVRKALSRSV